MKFVFTYLPEAMMNFKDARKICNFLSKEYAESFFRLLKAYQNISASEAASRLNVHIQTAQDFLETMTEYQIVEKEEVTESKRPYYRYSLKTDKISVEIDLEKSLIHDLNVSPEGFQIRELKNSGAKFSLARNGSYFSNISIWVGEGRAVKERKINLTDTQGMFLYNLPFPDSLPESVDEIIKRADINPKHKSEIMDIVMELIQLSVIEKVI